MKFALLNVNEFVQLANNGDPKKFCIALQLPLGGFCKKNLLVEIFTEEGRQLMIACPSQLSWPARSTDLCVPYFLY